MYNFSVQIQRYLNIFPRQQIHTILQEKLQQQPQQEFRKALEFLDIQLDYQPLFQSVNSNKEVRSRALRRLYQLPFLISLAIQIPKSGANSLQYLASDQYRDTVSELP